MGVSARVSVLIYNPSLIAKSQLPTSVLQLADPQYQGKLAFAAGETDFQPIVTSVLRTYGEAATLQWLDGIKTNAGGHIYPDNETIADEVNRGAVAFGVVNQYYWYRMRAEIGASNMHSAITYFAPRRSGLRARRVRRGRAPVQHAPGEAQRFLAFLVSKQGQEIIAHSDQLRVSDRFGGDDRPARNALRPAAAELDHHRRAGRRVDGDRPLEAGGLAVTGRSTRAGGPAGAGP